MPGRTVPFAPGRYADRPLAVMTRARQWHDWFARNLHSHNGTVRGGENEHDEVG